MACHCLLRLYKRGWDKCPATFVKANTIWLTPGVCVCVCVCKFLQSHPALYDPMDCSLSGSSVHGIFQARVLEWVAVSFSSFSFKGSCIYIMGFPGGSDGKASACNAGDLVRFLGQEDPLEKKWQSTPALLPGKSHGRRSLIGYSPWGHKESYMTVQLHFHFQLLI